MARIGWRLWPKTPESPLSLATDGLKPLELDEDGKMVDDPHAWHSPKTAAIYVNNILKGVIQACPREKIPIRRTGGPLLTGVENTRWLDKKTGQPNPAQQASLGD